VSAWMSITFFFHISVAVTGVNMERENCSDTWQKGSEQKGVGWEGTLIIKHGDRHKTKLTFIFPSPNEPHDQRGCFN
jgi:hypothetical protein